MNPLDGQLVTGRVINYVRRAESGNAVRTRNSVGERQKKGAGLDKGKPHLATYGGQIHSVISSSLSLYTRSRLMALKF